MSAETGEPARPGNTLLYIGLVSFLTMATAAFFWSHINDVASFRAMLLVLMAPVVVPALVVAFLPFIFMQSVLAGVPSVSMAYAVAALRRNWRGVVGGVLAGIAFFTAVMLAVNTF